MTRARRCDSKQQQVPARLAGRHRGEVDVQQGFTFANGREAAGRVRRGERGLTLIELIVTCSSSRFWPRAAIPIARFQIKRAEGAAARATTCGMMRDAIDKYKDAADRGAFQTKVDSQNYPPDLDTLVKGVDVQGKKLKFLRKIPVDPDDRAGRVGMSAPCRTIRIPTPSAVRASSMCIPSRRARRWTGRSIRRGRKQASYKRQFSVRLFRLTMIQERMQF